LDVVGIGALNLDYIVNVGDRVADQEPSLSARLGRLFASRSVTFEWGSEISADEETIYAALEEVNTASIDASLGGSSFNAIVALARMQLDLKIGFVGVAGRVPVFGLSNRQVFLDLGVDNRLVDYDERRLAGICLSIIDGEDRTLCTHVGANLRMAEMIRSRRDQLVEYLSRAKIIHVTSFLDDETPAELLSLLRAVRDAMPSIAISFDPGHVWVTEPTPDIEGLISISDHLILNAREFQALGTHSDGVTDEDMANRILDRLQRPAAAVVVKRSDRIQTFTRADGKLVQDVVRQVPLHPDQVKDSTGAGDVFAAGVLAALASNRLHLELGSVLGMRLARHKLGYVGTHGHGDFAAITRSILLSLESPPSGETVPKAVFISHGRSPQWLAVKEFVSTELNFSSIAFDGGAWSGKSVTEALSRYLDQCSFAVCVLTAEDITDDVPEWARQNVVHEVGLFQGRYGASRVVLLVEDGCGFVPAAASDHIIKFPNQSIESTFWRLRALIRAELADQIGA
jgi:sugar/nucleoside kinase (ribokinase family)